MVSKRKPRIVALARLFACERGVYANPACPCAGTCFNARRVDAIWMLFDLLVDDPHFPRGRSRVGTQRYLEHVRRHAHDANPEDFDLLRAQYVHREIERVILNALREVRNG